METNLLIGIGVAMVAFERTASLVKTFKNGKSQPNDTLVISIQQLCNKIDLLVHELRHHNNQHIK